MCFGRMPDRPEGRSEEFWRKAVEEKIGEPPATDIAAVLTVIMRRSEHHRAIESRDKKVLDFREAVLRRAASSGRISKAPTHLERHLPRRISKAPSSAGRISNAPSSSRRISKAPPPGAHLEGANLAGASRTRRPPRGASRRRRPLARGASRRRRPQRGASRRRRPRRGLSG